MSAKTKGVLEAASAAIFIRDGQTPRNQTERQVSCTPSGALKDAGITVYHTGPGSHAYLAENAIKSLKMAVKSGQSWKQRVRDGYEREANARTVPSLVPAAMAAMAPAEVQQLHAAREAKQGEATPEGPKLALGALVLVQRPAETFRKVNKTENWGRIVHEVAGIDHEPGVVMYCVRRRGATAAMAGRHYRQQLKTVTPQQAELLE